VKLLKGIAVSMLLTCNAHAGIFEYSGVVGELSGSASVSGLYGLVEVGDIVSGTFSYDVQGISDYIPWDAEGRYTFNETNSSFTLSIFDASEGNSLLYDYSGHLARIITNNNWEYRPDPRRFPTIDAFTPVARLDSGSEVFLRFQNRNTNLDLITTDELPSAPLDFDSYNYKSASITIPFVIGQVEFSPTSLNTVSVPLPPSISLMAIGLLILGRKRYSKEKIG
jgi:hypothetical protein